MRKTWIDINNGITDKNDAAKKFHAGGVAETIPPNRPYPSLTVNWLSMQFSISSFDLANVLSYHSSIDINRGIIN